MSLLSAVLQEANKVTTVGFKKHRDVLFPKIKDLTERVQMLSWALQQNLLDTHVNYTVTKSLEQLNYKNRKANINCDYENVSQEIEILRKEYEAFDDEFSSSWQKLGSCYESFNKLCVAAEGKKILDQANREFGRYNYGEAMLAVKSLKSKIKSIKFDENLVKAITNLNAQAENQLGLYTAKLSLEWEDIFEWSEKKELQFLTYSLSVQQSDSILLKKVLKSLYDTERLHAELGLFSQFFLNQLLHNVIRHNCDIYTEENIGAIIFNIKINLKETKLPNYQNIFNNLTAIFGFLHSTLGSHFEGEQTFIQVFAETIRGKFFNKIVEDCIRNNLPSCESSYQSYKDIVIELDSFNKFLIALKFVEAHLSPLNKYIDDTECVLYKKKCDELLSDVRSLLKESLSYHTVVVGSVTEPEKDSWDITKPIFLPKCVISKNVKKIMSMVVEYLEESVKLPEIYRQQLVSYIKDIGVMYQCIVPKKFKIHLENNPSDIALFFNNCFYLAHGLVGPPWSASLPDTLANMLVMTLLDCIQDLRVLGLEKVSLYLQKQKSSIQRNIEAKVPSEPWSYTNFEQFDCAINEAITLLKDLKSAWHYTLPDHMYDMAMCTLVQALCQSILERVFGNSRPVSEELVFMIAVKIEDAGVDMERLFEEPTKLESTITAWPKFTKLPQLLRGQLLEVAELWKKNTFLCFTCEEVRQIVKIRFPDDKYRLKILKEIQ